MAGNALLEREAQFRCYAELNDFLPTNRQHVSFAYRFSVAPSIKDAIEAVGIPHTEVDLILVNGESVGFDHQLQDGDRVAVFPVFESLDISSQTRLRENPLRDTRFVLDVHLGKLARKLRMLGFDVQHERFCKDSDLVSISVGEGRIILTRDKGLLKNKVVTHGYWVRATKAQEQLGEVMERFDLFSQIKPFTRCMVCNGPIGEIEKQQVKDQLPEKTRPYHDRFYACSDCGKIYWEGSHYRNMKEFVQSLEGGKTG